MRRCSEYLRKHTDIALPIREVEFRLPQDVSQEIATWGRFFAVLFPEQSEQQAAEFWGFLGDGISSRHAEFCLERFPLMSSVSPESSLHTDAAAIDVGNIQAAPWDHSDSVTKTKIKNLIAKWASSQNVGQEPISPQDVFLYPKGMCAIGTLASSLVPASPIASEAVVFG